MTRPPDGSAGRLSPGSSRIQRSRHSIRVSVAHGPLGVGRTDETGGLHTGFVCPWPGEPGAGLVDFALSLFGDDRHPSPHPGRSGTMGRLGRTR